MGDSKVKHLAIIFDRENETYSSGELLTGRVLAEFTQPKKIRGVRIEIFGESVAGWSAKVPSPNEQGKVDNVMTTSREEYLSATFYVLGSNTGRAIELPAAQLSYPFSIQLPFDLPSSFEHAYGHIRYRLRAVFERPWKFDYEIKTFFTVLSNYNLNQKPQASLPIQEGIQNSFCCFCICPVGKVHVTISVPSSGFVPGQMIPVTVQCENESTVDVTKVKVCLQRKLKFYATAPHRDTKEEKVVVAEQKCENPFTTRFEDHVTVQLKVPQLPPSGLEYCSIMDLSYLLRVVISFSGIHCNVERSFPVLIGTVPLHETYEVHTVSPQASAPLLQQQPPSAGMPFLITPQTTSMPQPQLPSNAAPPAYPPHPGNWDSKLSPPPVYNASQYAQGAGSCVIPPYPGQNKGPPNN